MHFKNPEILYFLFALLVPILVHLFQLRRFKKEYFTNVRLLRTLAVQTRKSSKIKKRLLLACRIALFTCIIIAFAQPFFNSNDTKNETHELYVVLDNSFSMQAKGKKGELLKRAVQELLKETPENLNFSLLTNSQTYWNTDIKSIRNSLQNLNYSATPFQLDALLAKIKTHKTVYNKKIIFITDGIGINKKQLKDKETTVAPLFIIPKSVEKNNVSVDSVFINKTLDNFYEISIRLSSYGTGLDPIPLSLYNNSNLIAKTIVVLDSTTKDVNFTIPKQAFHGYVTLSDKGLSYDNTYYFSISKLQKTNVMTIGEPRKNEFLARIYTPNEFNLTTYTLASLNYNALQEQDAIVLNELDEIPQALRTTLQSFVEKGGNLIVIPSALCSIVNLNSFLSNFGSLHFNPLENKEKLITKINFNHPIYSTVFEKKVLNFQYPKTEKSFILKSPYPAVLSYEDHSPFLISTPSPIGKVIVFAAPIGLENSNFQQSPLIVPTFYKMALSGKKNTINTLNIGAENLHFTKASIPKEGIVRVKSNQEEFIPLQQILNNKVQITFGDYPEHAGNFVILNKKDTLEYISFNYARTESDFTLPESITVSDYKKVESIKSFFDALQTNPTNNQNWKWFIIFAVLFLGIEIAIIRFIK